MVLLPHFSDKYLVSSANEQTNRRDDAFVVFKRALNIANHPLLPTPTMSDTANTTKNAALWWRPSQRNAFTIAVATSLALLALLLLLIFLLRGDDPYFYPSRTFKETVDDVIVQVWEIVECKPLMVRTDDDADGTRGCLDPYYTLGPPLTVGGSPCPPRAKEPDPPNGGIVKCCDDEITALTLDSQFYRRRFLQEDVRITQGGSRNGYCARCGTHRPSSRRRLFLQRFVVCRDCRRTHGRPIATFLSHTLYRLLFFLVLAAARTQDGSCKTDTVAILLGNTTEENPYVDVVGYGGWCELPEDFSMVISTALPYQVVNKTDTPDLQLGSPCPTSGTILPAMGDPLNNPFIEFDAYGDMESKVLVGCNEGVVVALISFEHCSSPVPTAIPTSWPTDRTGSRGIPTLSSMPTHAPTQAPMVLPTSRPTSTPTLQPTSGPSAGPTYLPTWGPSPLLTAEEQEPPTSSPSPSAWPGAVPTDVTVQPTASPSSNAEAGTQGPSASPSNKPSDIATEVPTAMPSSDPTNQPTSAPTVAPSLSPTRVPSVTDLPTAPTLQPSTSPTDSPTLQPTALPSIQPTAVSTDGLTSQPTQGPTSAPFDGPTSQPTGGPSSQPTVSPSLTPTRAPSLTDLPTAPTLQPSPFPTQGPTVLPTSQPTSAPNPVPSGGPTQLPTRLRTSAPFDGPTS